MTSLLRGEDLGVERERGFRTTGEDKCVGGTEYVRNLPVEEAEVVQWRFAAGMSCGRQRFFETELSYGPGLVDLCNLGLSFDGLDTKCVGEGCVWAPGDMKDPNRGDF